MRSNHPTSRDEHPFSFMLRSARCGFYWSDDLRAYVRISPPAGGQVLVEVCPDFDLYKATDGRGRKRPLEYLVLDSSERLKDIIECIQLPRVKKYTTFLYDEDGNRLR